MLKNTLEPDEIKRPETKIKICGLSRMEDILAVNEALPDYAGFVFAKSRRQVSVWQAEKLRKALDERICPVGVFVDEAPERIVSLLLQGVIDMAQLHGRETPEQVEYIRRHSGRPVIKAMAVQTKEDVRTLFSYPADFLLADGGRGDGRTFDWSLLPSMETCFLAGGLNRNNVEKAIRRLKPYGVDVSSAVETDGRKDRTKILEFTDFLRKGRTRT